MARRCPICNEYAPKPRAAEGTVVTACVGCDSRLFLKPRDGDWRIVEVVERPPAGLRIELDEPAAIEPTTYREVDAAGARFRVTSSWRQLTGHRLAKRAAPSVMGVVLLLTTVLPVWLADTATFAVVLPLLAVELAIVLALILPAYFNRTTLDLRADRLEWRVSPIPSVLGRSGSLPLGAIERLEVRHQPSPWWLPLPDSVQLVAHTTDQRICPLVTRMRSTKAAGYLLRRLSRYLA